MSAPHPAPVDPRAASYPAEDPSAWWFLARADRVGSHPLAVDALGESFVLFRAGSGEVVVLDRYCPHLGADLADGDVREGRLVCPFHRWEFDGDGRVCHVPAGGKVPRIHARRWPAREVGGLVFVWRGVGGSREPPRWEDPLGGPLDGLRAVGHKLVEPVRTHVIEIVENSVDNQHFLPLHSQMCVPWTRLAVPGMYVRHDVRWERDPDRDWVVRFTDDAHLAFGARPIPRSGARATVSFLGPGGVVRLDFDVPDLGRITLVQTQTPVGSLRLRVGFHWYAEDRVPAFLASYVVGSWFSQWLVDVRIWERKVYRARPQLVAADGPVHELRRWYRQFFGGPDAPVADAG